ncbi:CAAX amino terminal protease/RDD family protein [Methanobacterium congolense]|uniref:CAAX amino terminal protease/RDD family protein n=2 Tax=Methanobacterium congolense TaxID=118062 RepID=A0A1D3KZE4_9EURY|nr:CAAX amino terminal protease/RDD family protein [Methanobacterium congolense]
MMVDVVEGVVLASVFRRVCAFVLDVLLLLMFFGFLFFIGLGASDLFVGIVFLIISTLVMLVYFSYFEGPSGGSTPGKYYLSLMVVDEKTLKPPSKMQSVTRNLLRFADLLPYFIPGLLGLIVMLCSDKNQRLGDKTAKTIVIQKKAQIKSEY